MKELSIESVMPLPPSSRSAPVAADPKARGREEEAKKASKDQSDAEASGPQSPERPRLATSEGIAISPEAGMMPFIEPPFAPDVEGLDSGSTVRHDSTWLFSKGGVETHRRHGATDRHAREPA